MKYTPSALVSQFSGKQGSTVASHNRFGPYFRNRVIGVNPSTPGQVDARNSLSASAKAWSGLTDLQRASWNSAAALITLVDRLGRSYKPNGFQYFMSCNRTSYVYSGSTATVDFPPVSGTPAALATVVPTADSGAGTFSVVFTPTPTSATHKILVEATPGLSQGINFINPGLYRQLLVTTISKASPIDIFDAWQAKFGALNTGQLIAVRATVISVEGSRSTPKTATIIAT